MGSRPTSRVDRTAVLAVFASCLLVGSSVPERAAAAGATNVLVSRRAPSDFALTADPAAAAWKGVPGVTVEKDRYGKVVPGHRSEVRSRWTDQNLYLLFVSPYEELHLKPNPSTADDTNLLWNWDVAEAFIGTDFEDIKKYKEFQVSPQGEWVDLAIDRGTRPPTHDTEWDSGYEVKARVDKDAKVWFGEMRIPLAALGVRAPRAGLEMRANFYRCQGPKEGRKYINWQPVHNETFHTPEAFGRMRLAE